ncbi:MULTISPECIES: nuclear transport factor 2 family protein [unclassified Mycobacterium]|uniref:nuclear transport factor 2 family protein n=1 Tax=unclassified Mycobacterium TaxID=2642494 RepID=UPI000740050C|nr:MULTISPECIES: nuclear transport factor 2 family protein [unclassified Mycobacterium]KUH81158.1 polyketide cyclase [Mycobacterium sp. GA-1999]KUH84158.1 polyketide cyclase [Mycobacterium sp. IS-1556]KUH90032.1 polyketide cyclase [Mycobacterium sp. GA-0227b]
MSNDITLSELQEFIAAYWYAYDEANYDDMAAAKAENIRFVTRSDSGASPFEELMSPELHGRDAVMEWLTDHRKQSPYPLRHHATNVHRTGVKEDAALVRFYIFVNQIANFVPFAVSSGIANVAVRRGADGLEFTEMEMVLDTTDSVPLAELATETAASGS